MKKFVWFYALIFLLFFPLSFSVRANLKPVVTIVNPVRISKYNKQPEESLKSQYEAIKENDLSATWLLTFDSLENEEVMSVVKQMNEKQEIGLYLEITKNFTEKAGVEYRDTGFWHHAGSVFLSGYTQEERKIFIDFVFEKYKEVFGNYPKSVGSWWTDSYSLTYMKEKYGIEINLGCADQFSTDNYQLWGQPWVMPYYVNKYHTGVPASNNENKLGVVNIQWAARDPLNGYYSSLYSIQDYSLASKKQTIEFFGKLVDLYTKNFGQITVGLESDLAPEMYKGQFLEQIKLVKEKENNGKVEVLTMSDYAARFKKENPETSFLKSLESVDFLGTDKKATWHQSSKYRLSYVKEENRIVIRDLRIYPEDLVEPYYISPNRDIKLSINIPSIFDEMSNKENVWILPADSEIHAKEDKIIITGKGISVPKKFSAYSKYIDVKKKKDVVEIFFKDKMDIPKEGVVIKDYSSEAKHFFKQKKAILYLLTGKGWNYLKKVRHIVPQEEVYALTFLSTLEEGKVVVYDNECLQCSYHTEYKPPAFSNSRNYVKKFSKHPIIKNSTIFNTETREDAKKALDKTNAQYVYLVKHEDYFESLPFSPGDLNVEKIFDNANTEIWRVK